MEATWAALDIEFAEVCSGHEDPPWSRLNVLSPSVQRRIPSSTPERVTLSGLIELAEGRCENVEAAFDLDQIVPILPSLKDLNRMTGLASLKESVLAQVLFFAQGLHEIQPDQSALSFLHTVIEGPPGTGKTEVAYILGNIFCSMGMLSSGKVTKITRADLVGGYLGQTAMKTKEAVEASVGGVMFIDEAYSLGHPERRDSFSKECLDTLCECLSHYKSNLMVIVAGYSKQLAEGFFDLNPGLSSRFPWRYTTSAFSPSELFEIFTGKCTRTGWHYPEELRPEWFDKGKDAWPGAGRDMEVLLARACIQHARSLFLRRAKKGHLQLQDMDLAYTAHVDGTPTTTCCAPIGMYT